MRFRSPAKAGAQRHCGKAGSRPSPGNSKGAWQTLDEACLPAGADALSPAMDMPTSLRPTQGQLALAAVVARGESSHGEAITTVPASAYTDPDNFGREQAKLFRRLPQVIAPAALLPRADMAGAHHGFGL